MTADEEIAPWVQKPLEAEQLLMENLPSVELRRQALVISPGRAQLAKHLHKTQDYATVFAWYLDLYDATQGTNALHEPENSGLGGHGQLEVLCGADLPQVEFDLVAMPVLKRGESELTRDLLQQSHQRLAVGGTLAVSVDNPRDNWLHAQLQSMLDKVSCKRLNRGCVYWGKKTKELKKIKDFDCRFAFRDTDERLIQVISRPGVFSHRRLDPGARQLILSADIGPGDNVLDMGCGAGPVALAAAFRTTGKVIGLDSHARAIDCLKHAAALNGLANILPIWNADGQLELPVAIDIALANPPYFGNDVISQHFVDTALLALRPGGALLVVTKKPNWYAAYFDQRLEDVTIFESSRYFIACGRKP